MFTFKLQIFLMRFFWRIKIAYSDVFSVKRNLRSPFSLVGANAQKTSFVGFCCFSHILQIAKSSNLTQIGKRIIQLVSINMVNMVFRCAASYIKPCQSMRQSFDVMNSNRQISCALDRTRSFSNKIRSVMVFTPSKNAGLRVVIQRFTQMFNGNFRFGSHDIQFTIKAAQ